MSVLETLDDNTDFTRHIIFTDESSLRLHHRSNVQNHHTWASENPRAIHSGNTYPATLNVWAGIVGQHIVIQGRLTGENYLEMLQDGISAQSDALQLPGYLRYQHDGCLEWPCTTRFT